MVASCVTEREKEREEEDNGKGKNLKRGWGEKKNRKRFFSNPLLPSTCNKLHDFFFNLFNQSCDLLT